MSGTAEQHHAVVGASLLVWCALNRFHHDEGSWLLGPEGSKAIICWCILFVPAQFEVMVDVTVPDFFNKVNLAFLSNYRISISVGEKIVSSFICSQYSRCSALSQINFNSITMFSLLLFHSRSKSCHPRHKQLHSRCGSKVECWSRTGASKSGRLSAWFLKITFPHSSPLRILRGVQDEDCMFFCVPIVVLWFFRSRH